MTPRQVELVQASWKSMLPIRDTFAEIFYGKLFSLDARLAPLFKGDMTDQGRSLAAMISIAARGLAQPETIAQALRGLGSRHAAYGVKDKDYETFAVALLWTLAHAMDEAFTEELAQAWTAACGALAKAMIIGDPGASTRRARD
jgi:hemoglobin-like flavoprotein